MKTKLDNTEPYSLQAAFRQGNPNAASKKADRQAEVDLVRRMHMLAGA